ncbi:MAG: TonB-dependent receptor [Desulfurivibrio sp.]|nr:TonB-dependent receptor [Desulfurivibrio sp.]MBU4119877.1 TonB-dependent receptor [Pseudomonadota bacterium]
MRKNRVMTAAVVLCLSCATVAMAADSPPASTEKAEIEAFEKMFGQGPQEGDVYRTDRLLLTATGSLKPVHLAPSVASVITAEDIKGMGATTLDEVLETVPGLHVEPSGSQWFSSIWSIRGVHTSLNPQVLLLINGVPFTSSYQGSRFSSFQMPVAMISRVEVVRGPGSALHGADAFSGTVNVITKDNFEIDGTQAGARYGSFDTSDIWAQHGGQYGGFDLAFGVERRKSGGDTGRIIERDYLHAVGASALSNAPGYINTANEQLDSHLMLRKENWTLRLYGSMQEAAAGPGGFQAITYGNDVDTKSLLADLAWHNDTLAENWELESRIYYSYIYQDSFIQYFPAAFLNMLGNPIYTSRDGGAEAGGLYKGFRDHRLRIGVGAKSYDFGRDQYKNFGAAAVADPFGAMVHVTDPAHIYIDEASRTLWYGLIQDEWQFARHWTLTVGLRHDEYSDFGPTVNPRAALVWETRYDLTTKLMYGQAFRAPSFGEQYVKNNPVVIGNQNLMPEEIETIELAFDYQPTKNLRLILSLFNYEATELIEAVGPSLPQAYTNNGEQEGRGFEVELDWLLHRDFRLRANFAYQRSTNKKLDDAVVPDAPGQQFYLNPIWTFLPDWSLNGQFYWIGDRHRAQGDPRGDIADYEVVNLIVRRKNIANHWEAAAGIQNLFDEVGRISSPHAAAAPDGAYIPYDYPIEGRAVWAELKYYF